MSILSERPIEAAFRFSYTVASRKEAERIRGLLEKPAGGLRLTRDSSFRERSGPE